MDNGQGTDPREERRIIVSRIMDPRTYGITYKLDSPEAIGDAITRLRSGGVNILGPETRIDYIPRFHQVSLRWELVDPFTEGNWYKQAGGGLSMHFVSLNRLAMIAGITWGRVERDDDGSVPLYWRVRLSASVKLLDGSVVTHEGLGEADLRDDSAEVKKALADSKKGEAAGWDNVIRMRAKGSQRCESIAKAGLIRKMLGIRAKYSNDEAEMPFVWPTLVFAPPPDPELDRALLFKAAGMADLLYPRANVIDATAVVVPPRQLEERAPVRDFRAEAEKLDRRERVPVEQEQDRRAAEAAGQPARPSESYGRAAPPPTERAPWDDEEPTGDPSTPSRRVTWQGLPYTADEIRAFCAARQWLDATAPAEAKNVPKFVEWANGKGASTLSAFFAK